MSKNDNKKVILALTVSDARRISEVLYQAESSAWFIDAMNQSNKRRGIPSVPARHGEDYSEIIKEAHAVRDLFMSIYARGVAATCDITPFDDVFTRRPVWKDYDMYPDDEVASIVDAVMEELA